MRVVAITRSPELSLHLHKQLIPFSSHLTPLGLHLDSSLPFSDYISLALRISNFHLFNISKSRDKLIFPLTKYLISTIQLLIDDSACSTTTLHYKYQSLITTLYSYLAVLIELSVFNNFYLIHTYLTFIFVSL